MCPWRADQSVNEHDPQKQVVSSPEPAILHFGVRLLGIEEAFDQVGFTRTQVALTGAARIAVGTYADPIVVGRGRPTFR